jgi:protein-S-isoprenylcysteine O-methyltransferase Ste14
MSAPLDPVAAPPAPRARPFRKSLVRYAMTAALLAVVLFLGSGRLDWMRAWLLIGVTVGAQIGVGVALQRISPDLLTERSRFPKDTAPWDKVLAPLVALVGPVAVWLTAAWDMRVGWPPAVPVLWSALAFAVCVLGIFLTSWAMATNRFFTSTVRIQAERGHVPIESGPYRYMRHPGYSGALAFTLASPVALGSWRALIPAALTAAVLVLRTALEDRTLRAGLPGYEDYSRRTRSRLLPPVW